MKLGRPKKEAGTQRVALSVRVDPETAKVLSACPDGAGRALDRIIKKYGRHIMNTTTKIIIGFALIANVTACKVDTDADDAANTIAEATGSLEDKLDEILQQAGEIGAVNNNGGDEDSEIEEYGEIENEVESESGSVYVATYHQVANTCGNSYGLEEYLKLYSKVIDGKLSGETFFTDLNATDILPADIDQDSGLFELSFTGTSPLDTLDCACEIDANGFSCHCEKANNSSCAAVYDVI